MNTISPDSLFNPIKKLAGLTRPPCNLALPGHKIRPDTRDIDSYLLFGFLSLSIISAGGHIRQCLKYGAQALTVLDRLLSDTRAYKISGI